MDMLKLKSAVEYFYIKFNLPDEADIDENQAREQADAWMQKKYGDLFMAGYVFDHAWATSREYVVVYSR